MSARWGRYTLEERIGVGGQGEVWRAVLEGEAGFRKAVALKRLRPEVANWLSAALINEALIGARLDHPNVVTVHELFREGDELILAMELLDGEPLDRVIARHPHGLEPGWAVDVVAQIAAGLAYAHGLTDEGRPAPVVHRDLKPENVFVTKTGAVKILDFGIAVGAKTQRTTAPGATKGTVGFLAPELLDGDDATPASDVWALGALAYELALGTPLVPDMPLMHALARIQTADSAALGDIVGDRVPALGPIVRGCLSVDPLYRPSAGELAVRLRRSTLDPVPASASSTWTPAPAAGPSARTTSSMGREWTLAVVALFGAGVAGTVGVVLAVSAALVVVDNRNDARDLKVWMARRDEINSFISRKTTYADLCDLISNEAPRELPQYPLCENVVSPQLAEKYLGRKRK